MNAFFIIGTDTGTGKTYCTELLLKSLRKQNKTAIGIKPVASGATWRHNQLQNEDAMKLINASSIQLPYEMHNPFVFADPIAPHIAARKNGIILTTDDIIHQLQPALAHQVDFILLEGAGGLFTPLNSTQLFSDLIQQMNLPAILTIDLKLGGINHALLTIDAMTQRKLTCFGWIANNSQPETHYTHLMLEDLRTRLPVPHLMTVHHHQRALSKEQTHFFL